MSGQNTWHTRGGDRWRASPRDDYSSVLVANYALYIVLLSLSTNSSILNEGELNSFVMGDDRA